jgi:hypothetical protein
MDDFGPFHIGRALFALALTAAVCIGAYVLIGYLLVPS